MTGVNVERGRRQFLEAVPIAGIGEDFGRQGFAAAQIGLDVFGLGRRNVAGAIGRGRNHRPAERGEDIARHLVVRNAHGNGVEAGSRVEFRADDVPDGISAEDHAAGLTSSLTNLATYLER